MIRRVLLIVAIAIGLLLSAGSRVWGQASTKKDHLALGNPSGAKADPDNPDPKEYLIEKDDFALSYNSTKGTPNWVSWRLVKEDCTPSIARKDTFHPDTTDLPASFFQVKPKHYDKVGFDQGHMCPNGDRDVDAVRMNATFVMTNMVPQSPELNRQSWRLLEDHCRDFARKDKEVYIVAGPAGKGGHGCIAVKGKCTTPVFASTFADGKITVPAQCWKVVLVIAKGDGAPETRVTKDSLLFAVVMANDQTKKKWEEHQVAVAEVEMLTTYKFFSKAPADVMEVLRKKSEPQARLREQRPAFAGLDIVFSSRIVR